MPGTAVNAKMYTHQVNVVKGWFDINSITKTVNVASGEVITVGRVCYISSAGTLRLGLPDNQVPLVARQSTTSLDVTGEQGNIIEQRSDCLVSLACFELWTTEYDTDSTYHYNDMVTAWGPQLPGYVAAKKGLYAPGTPYVETAAGWVSAPVAANQWGVSVLQLWTDFLPIANPSPSSL